jgi:hypothetical protein
LALGAASIDNLRSRCLTMHTNKVNHVTTISRVAEYLGESEDWLFDVAMEMEIEDGVIWVYGVGEDGVMAFTDFGIENLIDRCGRLKLREAQARARSSFDNVTGPGQGRMVLRREV